MHYSAKKRNRTNWHNCPISSYNKIQKYDKPSTRFGLFVRPPGGIKKYNNGNLCHRCKN
jgi:hypothetical protein